MAEIKDIKLGNRLSYLRKRKKMTLDELATKSGVSKSILSQIERDMSNPTVSTISRISHALEENLSDLFSKIETEVNYEIEKSHEMPSISSQDGLCHLTILGAGETVNWLQWYLLTMEPSGVLDSSSHGPKTYENLTVLEGEIELVADNKSQIIKKRETYRFQSNTKHLIKNKTKKKSKVLMINYIDPINGSFN
jgi:transcriptional regulator with XRE-family HTH domain